jgi:hypothetical protein
LVELDVLLGLDGIQWLGCSEEVSKRYGISQQTISSHCLKALSAFDLTMERQDGEWELIGDTTLIQMEREVHQLGRLWKTQPVCAKMSL